mmetsp:Transcript_22222/g.35734  ORF Transcript_22222/g.35734 Transcript_22222/m.35734 type:complete len:91 (+) Transcript_22222:131-403(+)
MLFFFFLLRLMQHEQQKFFKPATQPKTREIADVCLAPALASSTVSRAPACAPLRPSGARLSRSLRSSTSGKASGENRQHHHHHRVRLKTI